MKILSLLAKSVKSLLLHIQNSLFKCLFNVSCLRGIFSHALFPRTCRNCFEKKKKSLYFRIHHIFAEVSAFRKASPFVHNDKLLRRRKLKSSREWRSSPVFSGSRKSIFSVKRTFWDRMKSYLFITTTFYCCKCIILPLSSKNELGEACFFSVSAILESHSSARERPKREIQINERRIRKYYFKYSASFRMHFIPAR